MNQPLYGEALRSSAQPWLDEQGKSDRERLQALIDLAVAEKTRLSDCLEKLFPGVADKTALADFSRLRNRVNDAAKAGLGFKLQVDTQKQSPPVERLCWFTGPDRRVTESEKSGAASVRDLDRLPAFVPEQAALVYNPIIAEQASTVDFAIMVALKEEFDAVYGSVIPLGSAVPLGRSGECAFVFTLEGLQGAIAFVGQMGPQPMADLTRSVIERFKPRIISLIGIAGGLSSDLLLGDVLVADVADEYLRQAKAETDRDSFKLALAGEVFRTTDICVKVFRNWQYTTAHGFAAWQKTGAEEVGSVDDKFRPFVGTHPGLHIGHIATGDVVGGSPAFGALLKGKDRKFAAIDMEATGLLSAAHVHAPTALTVVLRGISDFADERKAAFDRVGGGHFRWLAMRNATRLFCSVVGTILSRDSRDCAIPTTPIIKESSSQRAEAALDGMIKPQACYQPSLGFPVGLAELANTGPVDLRQGQVRAADYIVQWIKTGESPFLAVLGEYGIGKTVTLKHVTRTLLDERKTDQSIPLPIYVDLREDYLPFRPGTPLPHLEDILNESIGRNWKLDGRFNLTAKEVLQLVREERAVLIFDGLDEKIVHMDAKTAQGFIRELWHALPKLGSKTPRGGKLILSCRSHYFPTIREQNNMLKGEGREGIRDEDYRACVILPFNEDQIKAYLREALGKERFESAWELIAQTHNLREISTRPYLLSLVSGQVARLEQQRAAGQAVYAVTLYGNMVDEWLGRDAGKHKFSTIHKQELMEDLSAVMWQGGVREWPWEKLEKWLEEFYASRPVWQARYASKCDFDLLLEDLRTATFVVRPDTSPKHFRFAHTSLQEYFLACYLVRSLRDKKDEAWKMPMVSMETLDFLGQLLTLDLRSTEALRSMERIIGASCLPAACLAFQYWLEAIKHGHPEPKPKHVNLEYAEASNGAVKGHSVQHPLDLRGANLKGIRLNDSRVEFVDVTGADLSGMQARQALLMNVNAAEAKIVQADVAGAKWRKGSLMGADLTDTDLSLAEIIEVSTDWAEPLPVSGFRKSGVFKGHTNWVSTCAWSPDGLSLVSGSWDQTLKVWDAQSGAERFSLTSHASVVSACAWSPDGLSLVSGSWDRTLKVWDAQSGVERFSITGHTRSVLACAWSPDGHSLVSGSEDKTLKVWDAQSGVERFSLCGHGGGVTACAWSPDGHSLVSGSEDKTLKVWDAQSGAERFSLTGHAGSVMACAWSPDGRSLVSGSEDKTLKVWDAQSGAERFSLGGHAGSVTACAWSPDGCSLVSGLKDNPLKVWDAQSGAERFSLAGITGVFSACAWSPDGRFLVSASYDDILKVWDAQSGAERFDLTGHVGDVSACAWSPDGLSLVSGSWDQTLKVWDAQSGSERFSLVGHTGLISACAWSPDGRSLLSGSWDKTLKVWDAQSGVERLSITDHTDCVRACAWSPDGRSLVSCSDDNTLKVWDAQSGAERFSLTGHIGSVLACAWSPDGCSLVSGSFDKTLRVWDAQSGALRFSLTGHAGAVTACAWSPDGRSLVSGSWDNTLKVWEAQSGAERFSLNSHASSACAWSPDGRFLVSSSTDKTLMIWEARTGVCLRTIHPLPENQWAVISGDQQKIERASQEAWRWLGWQTFDAEGRFLKRLPAEAFGPIEGIV